MKKLLLLFFCLCISCVVTWAKDYLLAIDFIDGTEITIALSKRPVVSFANQNLCISVDGETTEFELANVSNFHFKEEASAIRSLSSDNDLRIVWKGEDLIAIPHAASDTQIHLYGIDGTFYRNRVFAHEDHFEVSLAGLPKGIYLLNINNYRAVKINRK